MAVRIAEALLAFALLCSVASGELPKTPGWADAEVDAFNSLLEKQLLAGKALHVVEFGGGGSTVYFSQNEAVLSWTTVNDHLPMAIDLKREFEGSSKVAIKALNGDFSVWDGFEYDQINEEGTSAEFESYINEIQFFGEKMGTSAYWVANFGRARVDVGIAALPLLVKTGGVMIVQDWDRPCYSESLLQFYDLDTQVGNLAVLRPKHHSHLQQVQDGGNAYDWCFSWADGKKVVRKENAPADTSGVMQVLEKQVGCQDLGGHFDCDESGKNCLSCYAALISASKRGMWVGKALTEAILHATGKSEL
jgi:hypothetical protein